MQDLSQEKILVKRALSASETRMVGDRDSLVVLIGRDGVQPILMFVASTC